MKKSLKCKNCGTVNWATAEICVFCKADPAAAAVRPVVDVPTHVRQMLSTDSARSRQNPYFRIAKLIAAILIAGFGFYFYSETFGLDSENKTSFLSRLYWGKKPPSQDQLTADFAAELKCLREYNEIETSTFRQPCLSEPPGEDESGNPKFQQLSYESGKPCDDAEKIVPTKGESSSVTLLKFEPLEGRYEKHSPVDRAGGVKGRPEEAASLFFRAKARLSYVQKNILYAGGTTTEDNIRNEVFDLTLYWDKDRSAWVPTNTCNPDKVDKYRITP